MNQVHIFKALKNQTDLKILDSVKNKNQCTFKSIPIAYTSQPNGSHNIKNVKNTELLSEHGKGTNIFIKASNKHSFETNGAAKRRYT